MIRDLVKWHKRGTFLLQASVLYMEVAVGVFLWREDPAFPSPSGAPRLREPGQSRLVFPAPKTLFELIDG